MKLTIPNENKQFSQPNKGDYAGTFWSSWNLDIHSEKGRIRLSPLMRIGTWTGTGLGTPYAFIRTLASNTDQWWAWVGGKLWKTAGTNPTATFALDAISGTPTDMTEIGGDLVEWNGALIAARDTDISRLNAGVWNATWWSVTAGSAALITSTPHSLCAGFNNLLLVADGKKIHTEDINNNQSLSRITLKSEFEVLKILSSNSEYWILASNKYDREARVFRWDGSAENFNQDYGVQHSYILSGVLKDEILYIVNGAGQLMKFTGGGMTEVAVFPSYGNKTKPLSFTTSSFSIHKNGMAVIDGKIHIVIDSSIDNTLSKNIENFPSGVWTYDEKEGLIHKYGFASYDGTEFSYGTNMIITPGAIAATTKDQGVFLTGARIYNYPGDSTGSASVYYVDTTDALNNSGYFVTPRIESSEAETLWKRTMTRFKEFTNSTDRIVIKYRTSKNVNLPTSMTAYFTDTTTLTTSGALTNVSVGDEIEFLIGRGEGTTRHISSISGSTIVIDTAITNGSGTVFARFQNWTKLDTISTQGIRKQFSTIDKPGEWIQFKVQLQGSNSSPELESLTVSIKPQIKANI